MRLRNQFERGSPTKSTIKTRVRLARCVLAVGLGCATLLAGCIRERVLVYCSPVTRSSDDYEQEYQRAYAFYQSNRFWEALRAFSALLDRNPKHPLADDAQYLVGACYLGLKDHTRAIAELKKVLLNFSHSDKCDAALFKLGEHYFETGCRQQASCYFIQLREEYPKSGYAKTAGGYLKRCGMSPCQ